MISTVWSVSCLLFFYSRCPPYPAICKSWGARAPVLYGVGAGVQHSSRPHICDRGRWAKESEGRLQRKGKGERGKQRIKVSLIEEVVLCFLREGIRGGLLFHLIQRYRGNAYIA